MITTFAKFLSDTAESNSRLTTRSLRDDEIRAIADATYRDDNPMRFEGVRQAALMFERAGYWIHRGAQISALAIPLQPMQPIAVGGLVVDPMHRMAHYQGRELDLKPREFGLLEVLARHPGQVFSRVHLLDLVWPREFPGDERTVDVHVARIRRVLDEPRSPRLIITVHGVGYKLDAPRVTAPHKGRR
jgi:DNA-binding response OmpR family regulator